jgi:hypothetical protein
MTITGSRMPTRTTQAVHAAAATRLALLLQDTAEFPSLSMKRHAASLSEGLSRVGGEVGWQIEMPEVHEPAALARFAGHANVSRWGRLVRTPVNAARRTCHGSAKRALFSICPGATTHRR